MRTSFAVTAFGMAALAVAQNGLISASSRTTTPSPTTFASGTTTIRIFEAAETFVDASGLAGSIINANAIATTVLVQCTDNDACGMGSITMTAGPSTWGYAVTTQEEAYGGVVTVTIELGCDVISSTQAATCKATEIATASYDGQKTDSTSSSTVTFASTDIFYNDLLITAGVEKLTSPQATETPKGAAAPGPVPTGSLGVSVGGMAAAAVVAAAGLL